MGDKSRIRTISFFSPRGIRMQKETRVIKLILAGWLLAIVGFQILVYLLVVNYSPLLLDELTFFNLPVHFWFTGQFLPLWFIILCVLFDFWMDRQDAHAGSHDGTLRFRLTPDGEEDE